MKNVIVLGSGCSKCSKTAEVIETIARELGTAISLSKDTSPQSLIQYGVMRTPAVVIDDQLVHTGSIPQRDQITGWLTQE